MSSRDFLNILFRRKRIVTGFFVASLVGGYAGLKLIPPTYEATARLVVRIGSEDIYMPALRSSQMRTPVMSVIREEQLRTESNLLTDPHLARKVVADLTPQRLFPSIDDQHAWYSPKGLLQKLSQFTRAVNGHFFPLSPERTIEDRAVSLFRAALKAQAIKSSNLIEVSMRSLSPDAAALGVNALLARYLQDRPRIFRRERDGFFGEQLAELDAQLQANEAALAQFRTSGHVLDLDRQRVSQVDNLNDIRKRIDENVVANTQEQQKIKMLRRQLAIVPPTTQVAGAETANALALSELSKQLAEIQRREVDIAQRFSSADPRLSSLRDEREILQGLIHEQRQRRYSSSEKGINPLHARIRDDLLQAEAALAGLREAQASLKSLEEEVVTRLGKFNMQEAGYKQLTQQREVLRETRQFYLEKAEEARLASAQAEERMGNVSVVSYAQVESRPVSPRLGLVLLAVVFCGLFGGVGLAVMLDLLDDSLGSDADIRRYLKLPLLARVPEVS